MSRNSELTAGQFTLDLRASRTFKIGSRATLETLIEAFNLFNQTNFDLPGNTEDGEMVYTYTPASAGKPATFAPPASVGKIFNTVGDSREIQFALKFIF